MTCKAGEEKTLVPYKKGEQYSTFINIFPGPRLEYRVNTTRTFKKEITKSKTRMPFLGIYPRAMKMNAHIKAYT